MADAIRWTVGAMLIYLVAALPTVDDIPFFAQPQERPVPAMQLPSPDKDVPNPNAAAYHSADPTFICTSACDFGVILSMAR